MKHADTHEIISKENSYNIATVHSMLYSSVIFGSSDIDDVTGSKVMKNCMIVKLLNPIHVVTNDSSYQHLR